MVFVCFFPWFFHQLPSFRDPQVGKVHQARRIRQRLSAPEAAAVVRREHHQAGTVFQGVAGEVFDDLNMGDPGVQKPWKTWGILMNYDLRIRIFLENMGDLDELRDVDPTLGDFDILK